MKPTRRDLALLLPALAAASANGAEEPRIASHAYRFEDLPARQNGANVSRPIFTGTLHTGFLVEAHETELAPGKEPHPPHHHPHEEMMIVIEGTVDFTVNGATTKLGPGGIAFAASNDEHGLRNNSDARTRYAVIAFRGAS
jgi:quercetin dioxygenase-like cupin family protein